jgi:hypothetical protein
MKSEDFEVELTKYDFAVHLCNADILAATWSKQFNNSTHIEYCGSARLYSYIRAALPIIMGNSMHYNASILRGTGYLLELPKDGNSLNLHLQSLKMSKYKQKISSNRAHFSFDRALKEFRLRWIALKGQ